MHNELTETRLSVLAVVSTDSDLYLGVDAVAKIRRLQAALEAYGKHDSICLKGPVNDFVCTCGLDDELKV